jgi:putative transcriptional regulator
MKAKAAKTVKSGPRKTRDVFGEIMEGVDALAASRKGKMTLRTHPVEYREAPTWAPKELVRIREKLHISRPVFARYLRTNVRTLENWEQGRAKPNAQAALLISLVKEYPDTVKRLASI